jgi:O-antigen ligase
MFMLALIGAGDVLRRLGQKPSSRRRAAISMPKLLRAFEVSPLGVAVAVLAITGALLTQSRAGLASGAMGFLVLFLCGRAPRQAGKAVASTIALVAGTVAVAALLLLAEFAIGRFSGAVGEDFSMRWALVRESWSAFLAEPLTGHGLNSFHEINAHHANPATWSATRFVGAAHNIFTEWLEETGLIGAALMVLILAGPLSHAVKASRDASSARAWAAVAIAVCAVCGLHGLFDFGLEIPAIAALFGLILGAFAQPLAAPAATARQGQSPAIAASNTASLDAVVIR